MRKISEDAYNAFIHNRRFNKGNTAVVVSDAQVSMMLFGNMIAKKTLEGTYISSGGYHPTVTTRDRLSAFVDISICKGEFIIKNKKWDGEWTNINQFN